MEKWLKGIPFSHFFVAIELLGGAQRSNARLCVSPYTEVMTKRTVEHHIGMQHRFMQGQAFGRWRSQVRALGCKQSENANPIDFATENSPNRGFWTRKATQEIVSSGKTPANDVAAAGGAVRKRESR